MGKTVIFDFFGVICPDIYWAWLRGHVSDLEAKRGRLQELSNEVDQAHITTEAFLSQVGALTGYAPAEVSSGMKREVRLDEGVVDQIRELKRTHRVGLISNASIESLRPILARFDLESLFDDVVISSEVGLIKPQPEIFRLALKRLGARARETVFVDDREVHVKAAERLGMRAIHFTDAGQLARELGELADAR